jgi:cell division protein FtsA
MEKYIAAVDLGTKRITVLVGTQTASGKFHILTHHEAASQGVVRGEVLNNVEVGGVLKMLIDELRQQTDINIAEVEVYAGVSGRHVRCVGESEKITRNNPAVEISEKEIRYLKQEVHTRVKSGYRALDVIPQNYYLDSGHSISPVGICSHRLEAEFRVLMAADFPIGLVERSAQRAGLQLKGLFLSPLAAAEAVLLDDEKAMGVAVVDIGGGTTDVVVYCNNIVRHVAIIPFGSDVITEDIHQGCAIPQRYAEQLKVQYGSCYSDLIRENPTYKIPSISGSEVSHRMLTNIIEARMAEIIEAVEYEIQQSGYAGQLNAGIVLTGGGAKLGDLTEFVRYKTGMKARKGDPLLVTSDSPAEVQHSDYATAVGLLMKGAAYKEYKKTELFDLAPIETAAVTSPKQGRRRRTPEEKGENVEKTEKPKSKYTIPGIFDLWFKATDNEI